MFGWTMHDAGPGFTTIDTYGGLDGGIMQNPPAMPSYVTIYVQVDDLHAALSDATRLGGSVVLPPTDIDGRMSFALFADPGGALSGLLRGLPPPATVAAPEIDGEDR